MRDGGGIFRGGGGKVLLEGVNPVNAGNVHVTVVGLKVPTLLGKVIGEILLYHQMT